MRFGAMIFSLYLQYNTNNSSGESIQLVQKPVAMSTWETFPPIYRKKEVSQILKAVQAGECVSIIGLSGSGKSNLMGFITAFREGKLE